MRWPTPSPSTPPATASPPPTRIASCWRSRSSACWARRSSGCLAQSERAASAHPSPISLKDVFDSPVSASAYEVLGVEPAADEETLRRAYRLRLKIGRAHV